MSDDAQQEAQHPFPVIRGGLPPSAPLRWLAAGWDDFRACGLASLFYGACFALAGLMLLLAFRHVVQLVTAVTTGFMLSAPSSPWASTNSRAGASAASRSNSAPRCWSGAATWPRSASTR